jgi:hypothetical protein
MRHAIASYCERHKSALADVAANGMNAARKYKYVGAVYSHEAGLGNRIPGMVSAFFVALLTGEFTAHWCREYLVVVATLIATASLRLSYS